MPLLHCVSEERHFALPVGRYYTHKYVYEVAVSLCLSAHVVAN